MDLFFCFILGLLLAVGLVILRRSLAEFPGQTPEDYDAGYATFDLRKHLDGQMICEGVIFGPMGRVTSSFVADFDIRWEGDIGVIAEHFRYDDGTIQDREWTITLGTSGKFTATAPDVPGVARGVQKGSAVQMCYQIRLPETAGSHVLSTVDWMYLTPDGSIINRSQFRKFGFRFVELVATIRPVKETA